MTPEQLYKHIETIYNHFEFKSKMLVDNFIIISKDNYYQCFISITDNLKLQFKISKHYSIVDTTNYKLQYEIVNDETIENYEITYSPKLNSKILCSDKFMSEIPQSFLNLFNSTLREFNLKMLLNEQNNTITIFEQSI
jgi:hypothetical protein